MIIILYYIILALVQQSDALVISRPLVALPYHYRGDGWSVCVCVCVSRSTTFLLTSNFCIFSPWPLPFTFVHYLPFPPLKGVEEEIARYRHGNHTDDNDGLHLQGCLHTVSTVSVLVCVVCRKKKKKRRLYYIGRKWTTCTCLCWDFFFAIITTQLLCSQTT